MMILGGDSGGAYLDPISSVLPLASKKPFQLLGKNTQQVPDINVVFSEEVFQSQKSKIHADRPFFPVITSSAQ